MTAAWIDFVVVVGLCLLFWRILRALKRMSEARRKKMEERIEMAIQMRKKISDPFRNTNGFGWDYCMVFKVIPASDKLTKEQEEFSLKKILNRLADAGVQTKMFYSVQNDEVIVIARI